ncbi:acetate kinase [Massilia litorea]|uniref:acetate kinase n=1 Tax=Massilia litorea TaxID=2769491 RepID=UPI001D0D3DE1|nr:acetate kinase [Massilia litorea]
MQKIPALCAGALAVSAAFCALPAQAQSVQELAEQVKAMRQQLEAQRTRIDELERDVRTARATAPGPAAAATADPMLAGGAVSHATLDGTRGTGNAPPDPATSSPLAAGLAVPASGAQLGSMRGTGGAPGAAGAPQQPAAPAAPVGGPASAPTAATNTAPVGRAPSENSRPREVAPIFEQPGVLTPRGKYVFEPALQYAYSSSNRVALVGYTVIPALLIGLIDVREVKRNTTTATATLRRGLTNRFEVEAKLPYVYRSDATVSREVFTGTAVERAFETSGKAIGDVELAARYQLNDGGVDKPFFIGGLRFKSRTGKDPFEVTTDCQRRCIGENITGSGLPLELPTGSGFYSLQPSLTWLFPSDPAVFFGSFSYLHNFKRDVSRTVLNGEKESLGEVAPGGVIGFNFGMGLALNDKASFSVGYDHNSVARTKQSGRTVPGSVRLQLGTLLIGYSYRLSDKKTLSVAVGAGLTRDTPDVTLMVRVPMSF